MLKLTEVFLLMKFYMNKMNASFFRRGYCHVITVNTGKISVGVVWGSKCVPLK